MFILGSIISIFWSHETNALAENYVVVLIDDSGSMDQEMATRSGPIRRIDAAKNALLTVLGNLPNDTNIGLLALNQVGSDGHWLYPLAVVDSDRLLSVVNQLQANGGTPLGSAMKSATDALLSAREKNPYGTFRLLVVTDGEATDSLLLETYLPDILRRGITVDVIGVDMQTDHSLATKVHQYRRADDAEALNQAVAAVFAESNSVTDQGGESDFDWIAGLPDEFAAESLAAISQIDNSPVGEQEGVTSADTNQPNSQIPVPFNPPPFPVNTTNESDNLGLGFVCCCFGSMLLIGILVMILLGASTRKRRG